MTTLQVLGRVYRGGSAFLVLAIAGGLAAASTATAPRQSLYPYVPAIAQAVFLCCAAAAAAAAVVALPRAESLEVTAARPQWRARLFVATGLYALLTGLAVVVAAASSWWYLGPLVRDLVVVAGATLALAVVVPARYVTVAALGYLLACVFASGGHAAWDIVLTPLTWQTRLAAVTLGVLGALAYALRGARPLPPGDDH